jgi:hypothetical protein
MLKRNKEKQGFLVVKVWFTQCFSLIYACTKRKNNDEFGEQLYKCHLKKCTYNFKLVVCFGRLHQFGRDNQWSYNVGGVGTWNMVVHKSAIC